MTNPRSSVPAPVKVIIIASLLFGSGAALSVASCFGTLSTINRGHLGDFWGYLLFTGLGFVALGVFLFLGIGVWAAGVLLKAGLRRIRGKS